MKRFNRLFVALAFASGLIAQTAMAQDFGPVPAPQVVNPTVKGTLDIKYHSRTDLESDGTTKPGVKDVYTVNLDVATVYNFNGTIAHLPPIFTMGGFREKQSSLLEYNITISNRNPKNLVAMKPVGKLVGSVPIDRNGAYLYESGTLRMAMDRVGKADEFSSPVKGVAQGKAPKGSENAFQKVKQQAQNVVKQVNGKPKAIVVTNYDIMKFDNNGKPLVIPAGPAGTYSECTVTGTALYDGDREAWLYQNVVLKYKNAAGVDVVERITGSIKWARTPNYATSGEGTYLFDVRVNEPVVEGEVAAFAPADDESAYWESDDMLQAFTGTEKYKDTFASDGETVAASMVTVDLVGNKLSNQQVANLTKLLKFVMVKPMNDD